MFQIGSKVVFLAEKGGGTIVKVTSKGKLLILDDHDGFEREYLSSQVVVVKEVNYYVSEKDINAISMLDIEERNKHSIRVKKKSTDTYPMIDLHIEELLDSSFGLTNFEIISKQMAAFKQFYSRSRSQKKTKIIVIHGVGEGILRSEIRLFLDSEDGVEYYDSSYLNYGQGATTIELKYLY